MLGKYGDGNALPLVSVVVPLFNYSSYIKWCIKSITHQSYDNWELIVVDDCSTDGSLALARSFESDRIKVIHLKKNSGYSVAKNEGIAASKGEFITCLDADDMLTSNSVQERVAVFLGKPEVEFVHAKALDVGSGTSLKQAYKKTKGQRKSPKIHAQTVMVRRSVYCKYGLYDEELRSRSDKEMWWRLFGKGCSGNHLVVKYFLDLDVAYYRIHSNSMMKKRRKDPKLQERLRKLLEHRFQVRDTEGITNKNTRFLVA